MDMVIEMEQMPQIGETVFGNRLAYVPGGKGANQACAASKLGGDIKMLGCIGEDEFGAIEKSNLAKCGVNIESLKKTTLKGTGTASIYVDEGGNNSIVVIPAANQECDIAYLKQCDKDFQECDFVILQMEIPYESIFYAINRAKELGKIVILNPAPAPDRLSSEILSKLDYITPNEKELEKLYGQNTENIEDYILGAKKMLEEGVRNVIITLGEQGVLFVNKEKSKIFPARNVEAIDTTAAGDCFNGAFVVALAEGKSDEEAIIFANTASSITVTRYGAQTSLPNREETDAALNR